MELQAPQERWRCARGLVGMAGGVLELRQQKQYLLWSGLRGSSALEQKLLVHSPP